MARNYLKITNARENNLKGISLEIPHDSLSIVTGLSGSGKSSLAFDTVYAEGQRRYIETFSPYTRQFFDKVKRPDVDTIENVRPAIAIQQRTRVTGSRSTVGTMTNINDYLKILWSNLAKPFCHLCGIKLDTWDGATLAEYLFKLQTLKGDFSFLIACPIATDPKRNTKSEAFERLTILGFSRFFDPGTLKVETREEESSPPLAQDGTLIVVLDRVKKGSFAQKRVKDSLEQAFSLSASFLQSSESEPELRSAKCWIIPVDESGINADTNRSISQIINSPSQKNIKRPRFNLLEFSNQLTCPNEKFVIEKPKPSLFSFNHPVGACPECKGFGRILTIDPLRCVPNPNLSIEKKAVQCWGGPSATGVFRKLLSFCKKEEISISLPWKKLSDEAKEKIFYSKNKEYKGVVHWFKRLERKSYKMHVRVFLSKYRHQIECPSCHGSRLKPSALAYRLKEKTLPDLWQMSILELFNWLTELLSDYTESQKTGTSTSREVIGVFNSILIRLQYLLNLGLSYITLDRQTRTLSGGETQRVNLAAALGSDLTSTHFVLDEPSVGLHARDTERLIGAVRDLESKGNSVLVVEHDLDFIGQGDHIIELGPKAGEKGGNLVFEGARKDWPGIKISLEEISEPTKKIKSNYLTVINASKRNLKGFDLRIPLECLVTLSGVSGSGKSTLVTEVILKAYEKYKLGIDERLPADNVLGFEKLDQVLMVDQSPLAKSPRANIGTYSGIWDTIRTLLSSSDSAIERALAKKHFSFNVDGGRCPACKGAGFIREDMQFLSDVYIPCELCLGKRFQPTVLEVKYNGKNASDFLAISVDQCRDIFEHEPKIHSAADTLSSLGLGHITLGHPLSELSGGEAQRLKLIPIIEQSKKAKSLLVFDEPTTGLHQHDVERLIKLLKRLRDKGHTVLVIEHNLSVIYSSDWIIDLGPEGGNEGGFVVGEGKPKEFLQDERFSKLHTAVHLRKFIKSSNRRATILDLEKKKRSDYSSTSFLEIKGAREHNLKNIDVKIPLNTFVSITGVSGSGKSTIAKDIIYAEGQRRYLDCLSPYARQFIRELKKPEIEHIQNIKPTICVYQHTFQPGSLSTVGTMSETYTFLRLLYSKIGTQYCPDHPDKAISPLSIDEISREVKKFSGKTVRILARVVNLKKGHHRPVLERATASEISQIRVDGVFLNPTSISMSGGLERTKPHSIDFVVGKFNPGNLDLDLIKESITQALSLGGGTLLLHMDGEDKIYSMERTCSVCKKGFFKPDPEDLSFHSKRGACSKCSGTGRSSKGEACPTCKGTRLNQIGRNLRLNEKNISDISMLGPAGVREFLANLLLDENLRKISEPILKELNSKLETLLEMGLEYIPLNRDCKTLSGGELQRLRLATSMGSPLSGVIYIFDEPSVGLHPLDNVRVLKKLRELKDRGNSIVMIEHDAQSICASDYVIDVGPGGGKDGGEIVFSGPIDKFLSSDISPTSKALSSKVLENNNNGHKTLAKESLSISSSRKNNISNLKIKLPLSSLVTVCGVSGAGKSSLVHGIIYETISLGKGEKRKWSFEGHEVQSSLEIARIVEVDQRPIGTNPRSTPASYLGIWDQFRKVFTGTNDARIRGLGPSYFSYNTGKGRCPECKGQGQIKLEMSFLPEARVLCETCSGSRFREDAKTIRYLGLSISDVLNLTFEEARLKFANHRKIHHALHQACELGLGYLTLGQNSATLSGGESQRIKLVSELGSSRFGHTIYILDEPTTGLHKQDVSKLLKTLNGLVAKGNTVIVIEHDSDIILNSDYVVELGPGPGELGGKVIFEGVPSGFRSAKTPWGEVFSKLSPQTRQAFA